jgi:hypothetical protein
MGCKYLIHNIKIMKNSNRKGVDELEPGTLHA